MADTGSAPAGRLRLRDAFVSPEAKRSFNRRLFSVVAPRYDLITTLLSYGQDQGWKDRVVELAAARPGDRVLDLACGTGDIALRLAVQAARVVGVDLTADMLRLARAKNPAGDVRLVAGDMTKLPVASGSMDVVTVGYGLRNVPSLDDALDEIHRVLRPGGRVVSLDFDKPPQPLVREIYLAYLALVGSVLGWALHGDGATYRYIAASLRRYPGAGPVADRMVRTGFDEVRVVPLLGGLMALHVAIKRSVPGTEYAEMPHFPCHAPMELNTQGWSGDGEFTRTVIDALRAIPGVAQLRVEDAPTSRAEAGFAFLSNEIYVTFATRERLERIAALGILPWRRRVVEAALDLQRLGTVLGEIGEIGAPDYADEGMLQYLRTERIIPPYQTKGYKLVEMVRIYAAGTAPRR